MIKDMLATHSLWTEPLQFIAERAAKLMVSDFIHPPGDGEYIDENATMGEAINQLVVQPYHSLLVTSDDDVVLGIDEHFADHISGGSRV